MSTLIYKYPLDLTGHNPNNLILGEEHNIENNKRAFVPTQGYFYTDSLIVRNSVTNQELIKGEDYKAIQLHQELTEVVGKEVCSIVVITKEELIDKVSIDYQLVGGEFSNKTNALINMVNTLEIDERAVIWGQIIGTPSDFVPTGHLHDIGDLYGFEFLVNALEDLRIAIILGDEASHEEMRALILAVNEHLLEHINDKDNPHELTKEQLQLENVENYPIATLTEMYLANRNDRYVTPALVGAAIVELVGNLLQSHIDDKNNPHNTTKEQVQLGLVQNFGIASKEEAEEGVRNDRYLTPLRAKEAIEVLAGNLIQSHIDDKNNPHNTTKEQVQLGLVQNFGIASKEEAEEGISNERYMTPLRTKEAITKIFNEKLDIVSGQIYNGYITNVENTPEGSLYTIQII